MLIVTFAATMVVWSNSNERGKDERAPKPSEWSAPVNLGAPPNSAYQDLAPFISKDGLSLYFCSNRPESYGGFDIFVSHRPEVGTPWGEPKNLGRTINSSNNEQTPTLSPDEDRLYFVSDAPGGRGGMDLYVSSRLNNNDDFAWQQPVNLGVNINSADGEGGQTLFKDAETGDTILYFRSNRAGGVGNDDIYSSVLQQDGIFGPARLVRELCTTMTDARPAIRSDGLEIFLGSDRPGSLDRLDLWVATRPSTADAWSKPVNLGPVINSAGNEGGPALSFDGTALYFHSGGHGGYGDLDLFVTTRPKPKGMKNQPHK